MKAYWAILHNSRIIAMREYKDKADAEALALSLTTESGKPHYVNMVKVSSWEDFSRQCRVVGGVPELKPPALLSKAELKSPKTVKVKENHRVIGDEARVAEMREDESVPVGRISSPRRIFLSGHLKLTGKSNSDFETLPNPEEDLRKTEERAKESAEAWARFMEERERAHAARL